MIKVGMLLCINIICRLYSSFGKRKKDSSFQAELCSRSFNRDEPYFCLKQSKKNNHPSICVAKLNLYTKYIGKRVLSKTQYGLGGKFAN